MDLGKSSTVGAIDPHVAKLALEFAQGWSKVFEDMPRFQLDFSWPSITTLGMLVELSRAGKDEIPVEMTRNVAAYIAVMAAAFWQVSPVQGKRIGVSVSNPGTKLHAFVVNEQSQKETLYEIVLDEAIRAFFDPERNQIFSPPSVLDTLSHFSPLRRFSFECFAGLSPLGSGSWLQANDTDRTGRLVSLDLSLARSTADFCQRVYPGDDILHNPGLFSSGVLSPPSGFNEPTILSRSALSLLRNLDFAIGSDAHQKKMETLATLSLINEPQVAAAALVSYIALVDRPIPASLKRLRRSAFFVQPIKQYLKPVIELVRASTQRQTLIELASKENLTEDESQRLEIMLGTEQELELLPTPVLNLKTLRTITNLLPSYYIADWQLIGPALGNKPDELLNNPLLLLMQANCELTAGAVAESRATLTRCKQLIPELGKATGVSSFWFYKLLADLLYLEDKFELALDLYQEAGTHIPANNEKLSSAVAVSQAVCRMNLGQLDSALELTASALAFDSENPEALILLADLSGNRDDIARALRQLPFSTSLLNLRITAAE